MCVRVCVCSQAGFGCRGNQGRPQHLRLLRETETFKMNPLEPLARNDRNENRKDRERRRLVDHRTAEFQWLKLKNVTSGV